MQPFRLAKRLVRLRRRASVGRGQTQLTIHFCVGRVPEVRPGHVQRNLMVKTRPWSVLQSRRSSRTTVVSCASPMHCLSARPGEHEPAAQSRIYRMLPDSPEARKESR
ncbi:hypothetical protein ANAPC5_01486 [Anaplasma phagocytophilum]|nr:hypothetical protein ANAPC5_01486 [Anaplasma phagocytophilum]